MHLESVNCVITGISGETGKALSKYLIERGATIIGTTRPKNSRQQMEEISAGEYHIAMDPLKPKSIENALNIILGKLQQIQVWINVVGGFEMGQNIEESSETSWNHMWSVNFQTVLNTSRVILPHFKKMKSGRLLNFGSASAETGMANAAPYLVSKAAVHALSKATAAELSGDITCNALLPRTIDTSKNRSAMPDADFSTWVTAEAIAEAVVHLIEGSANGELVQL